MKKNESHLFNKPMHKRCLQTDAESMDELKKMVGDLGMRVELLEMDARSRRYKMKESLDWYTVSTEDMSVSVPYTHKFIYLPKRLSWEQIELENKKYDKSREK
jgi:hypothetical protein